MKKNNISLLLLLITALGVISFIAPSDPISTKYKAYFGCVYTDNIQIDAQTFKQLMQQPLCAKDSASNMFKVKSFEITYAERGLYQDEEGLPVIVTDYTTESFTGDTLTSYWKKNFNERLYKGDTVFFERVICGIAEKKNFLCKTLKVVIK